MYFHLSSTLTYDFMSMMVTLKKLLLGYLRNKIDLNVAVNVYFHLSSILTCDFMSMTVTLNKVRIILLTDFVLFKLRKPGTVL